MRSDASKPRSDAGSRGNAASSNVELLDPAAVGEYLELPEGALITGYYVSRHDAKRYPFGCAKEGFWACDEFGWAMWHTAERRDEVIGA